MFFRVSLRVSVRVSLGCHFGIYSRLLSGFCWVSFKVSLGFFRVSFVVP